MEKSMKQPDTWQKRQKVYIGHYSITAKKTIHWLNNLNVVKWTKSGRSKLIYLAYLQSPAGMSSLIRFR